MSMNDKPTRVIESAHNERPTVSYVPKLQRRSADKTRYYYVYVLLCNDGKPYTGCTDDIKERKKRHDKKQVPATKDKLPVKLVSYFAFSNK